GLCDGPMPTFLQERLEGREGNLSGDLLLQCFLLLSKSMELLVVSDVLVSVATWVRRPGHAVLVDQIADGDEFSESGQERLRRGGAEQFALEEQEVGPEAFPPQPELPRLKSRRRRPRQMLGDNREEHFVVPEYPFQVRPAVVLRTDRPDLGQFGVL